MNKVEIVLANTGERMMVEPGTQVFELAADYTKQRTDQDGKAPWPILGALVNNKVEPLQYRIYNPKTIRLLDITSRQGFRMYRNALCMMLYKAVHDCYPTARLSIDHSLQNGFYCRINEGSEPGGLPTDRMEVCRMVRERMIALQEEDLPFVAKTMLIDDAIELVRPLHIDKTLYVLEHLKQLTNVFTLEEANLVGKVCAVTPQTTKARIVRWIGQGFISEVGDGVYKKLKFKR